MSECHKAFPHTPLQLPAWPESTSACFIIVEPVGAMREPFRRLSLWTSRATKMSVNLVLLSLTKLIEWKLYLTAPEMQSGELLLKILGNSRASQSS